MHVQLSSIGVPNSSYDPPPVHSPHFLSRCKTLSNCWGNVKECYSYLTQPYPPLSRREIRQSFGEGALLYLFGSYISGMGLFFFISSYMNSDEVTKHTDLGMFRFGTGFVGSMGLIFAIFGAGRMYKTCKAPRLGEEQALLTPDNT